jgi:hypothetical protein
MNSLRIVACLLIASAALVQPPKPKPNLSDLAWIAGCWESGGDEDTIRERWMTPLGGTMLGMSHTITDDKTVAYEFLRIHEEADGIYYTANPSGQAQNSFKLVKVGKGEAVFEDLTHDFPQRIIYRLEKDGGLMAIIEGVNKNALKQVKYPLHRVPCE